MASAGETKLCTPGIESCWPSSSPQRPTIPASKKMPSFFDSAHLCSSWGEAVGQFIDVADILQLDLLGVGRSLEGEIVGGDLGRRPSSR